MKFLSRQNRRLDKCGLLPKSYGWFPEMIIDKNIDIIILGMHARSDNPELLKAQKLGLKNLFLSRISLRTNKR
jgi:hypothetical protein